MKFYQKDKRLVNFLIWSDLQEDESQYFGYFCMKQHTFEYILRKVHQLKKYSNFRETISPEERLTETLRYLATGSSFKTLEYSFRMSDVTIGRIIHETCKLIWESLHNEHMPFPSEEQVDRIAAAFCNKMEISKLCVKHRRKAYSN